MYKQYIKTCNVCGKEESSFVPKNKYVCKVCSGDYTRKFCQIKEGLKIGKSCEICGDKEHLAVHHRDGNKKNDDLYNLMVICSQCHKSVHGHNLMMPNGVKWGSCGKRLIYREIKKKPSVINKDKRWGHVFVKRNNYLLA